MYSNRSIAALTLAISVALAGCASNDDASDGAPPPAVDEVNASAITLANYANHPIIKAIRAEVGKIDSSKLKQTDNPGCDGGTSKFTTPTGAIRKLTERGGEGGFSAETTAYYRENGKLLFVFDKQSNHTGATNRVTEYRVYFDADGREIWQVVRVDSGADQRPSQEARWKPANNQQDPAAWFKVTGCAPTP